LKALVNGTRVCSLLTALLLSVPGAAFAQDYRTALAHGAEARDRAEETGDPADWIEALGAFDEASQLNQTKEAKFELANAAAHLQLDDEACSEFLEALWLGLTGKAATFAEAYIESHRQGLATLNVLGPAGALLTINGRRRGLLPLNQPLFVRPGAVQLDLDLNGLRLWDQSLSLQAGAAQSVWAQVSTLSRTAREPSATHIEPPHSAPVHAWGTPVLIAGGTVATVGVALIVVTSALIPGETSSLRGNCVVLQEGDCVGTTASKRDAAQAAADHLETERNLRWAGLGTTIVGLGALTVGLIRLATTERGVAAGHAALRLSPNELGVDLSAAF
jgi:hypothetical protein